MNNLHLDTTAFKAIGGLIKIEAECERTNKIFNVWFQVEDIAFSLDVDVDFLEANYSDDSATDSICTAANDIYERYCTGITTYDIHFEEQKIKGYEFISQTGKAYKRCASFFSNLLEVEKFKQKNNFKSYKPILG